MKGFCITDNIHVNRPHLKPGKPSWDGKIEDLF